MTRFITFVTFIFIGCGFAFSAQPYVIVLGVAQDAGIPQMGCESPFCKKVWASPRMRKMVSSIALVDRDSGGR